jgi:hypothetical protein
MSVATVKTKLAAMQILISGVKHAFVQVPESLNTAELPAFINLTGQATDDWQNLGDGMDLEARIYTMRLYVLPVVLGIPGEGERLCEPFFTRVRDYFASHPLLGNLAGVQIALVTGDSGVIAFPFDNSEQKYLGIEFKLQVQEHIGFNYVE